MPQLLAAKKMSQAEFARVMDVSESFISQVINGKAFFSYILALKAAWILKCRMEDLHEIFYP